MPLGHGFAFRATENTVHSDHLASLRYVLSHGEGYLFCCPGERPTSRGGFCLLPHSHSNSITLKSPSHLDSMTAFMLQLVS